jgi:hypothetical protein
VNDRAELFREASGFERQLSVMFVNVQLTALSAGIR